MTRAEWYAFRYPATWRIARKNRRCGCRKRNEPPCRNVTPAGGQYFDTQAHNQHHGSQRATICICEACANEELKL